MILDQFGKPIRQPDALISPDWCVREGLALLRRSNEDRRIYELRASVHLQTAAELSHPDPAMK